MKGIVDRWEGDYAVIEIDSSTRDVPRHEVASDVEAGDVVAYREGIWVKLPHETEERKRVIQAKMNRLWADKDRSSNDR